MMLSEKLSRFDRSNAAAVAKAFSAIAASDLQPQTVREALFQAAERFPDKTALLMLHGADPDDPVSSLSYRELKRELLRAGHLLQQLGVVPGEPVAFLAPATVDGLIFYWAAMIVGAVAPINPLLSDDVIVEICNELAVRVLIAPGPDFSPALAKKVVSAVNQSKAIKYVISEGNLKGLASDKQLISAVGRKDHACELSDQMLADGDTTVAYFHTGGTTGTPKVARILNRNALAGFVASNFSSGLSSDHISLNGLPLFHVGGGLITTTSCIAQGQTLVQLGPAGYRSPNMAEHFWQLLVKHRVTQVVAVPTVFQDVTSTYRGEQTELKSLICGASKLPTALRETFARDFDLDILEGYGMTECAGFCAVGVSGLEIKPGSSGVAAPMFRLRIVDTEAGHIVRDCLAGEIGTVVIQGAGVFAGYTDPEKTREKFVLDPLSGETWLNSEDLGKLDEEGYLSVVGRSKDLIIRSGHNIDPFTIEETLQAHPVINEAAAVGMPDPRAGELPVAFVTVGDASKFDEAAVRDWCRERIRESGAVPVRIVALEELPRTAMNKVFKPALSRIATELAIEALLGAVPPGINVEARLRNNGQVYVHLGKTAESGDSQVEAVQQKLAALGLEVLG